MTKVQDDLIEAVAEEILIPGFASTKVKGIRHCAECADKFKPSKVSSRYCTPACKSRFNSREASRGAVLYRAMQHAKAYDTEHPDLVNLSGNPYQDYAARLLQGWRTEDMASGRGQSVRPLV